MPSDKVLLGLSLRHHRIVVAGAGRVSTRRVLLLLDSGARSITVVAPSATDVIADLASEGRITWREHNIWREDLVGSSMVIIATNDALVNSHVAGWASDLEIPLVNHAGHHEQGNLIFPPNWKGQNWQFAVHGGAGGPVFALWALSQFDHLARSQGFAVLAEVVATVREAAYGAGKSQAETSALLNRVLENTDVQEAARGGDQARAEELALKLTGLAGS